RWSTPSTTQAAASLRRSTSAASPDRDPAAGDSHVARGLDDRSTDARVGSASADVAQRVEVGVGDLPALGLDLLDEGDGGHDLTGLAVAALGHVVAQPRLLHRMRRLT